MESFPSQPKINASEGQTGLLLQGPDGHLFRVETTDAQPPSMELEAGQAFDLPKLKTDWDPNSGESPWDFGADAQITDIPEPLVESGESADAFEHQKDPRVGRIAAGIGFLAAGYAVARGFDGEAVRPFAEHAATTASERAGETAGGVGAAISVGFGRLRQRREAASDYHKTAGEKSRATMNPSPAYDPLKNFDAAHRTRKLGERETRSRTLPDGTTERVVGFAGDLLPERQPQPDQSSNPTSTLQKRAAMRGNLRADAMNKRRLEAEKYQILYGHHIGEKEVAEDMIANGRYTYFQKRAIRRASKLVRQYEESSGRIAGRLDKQATGKDIPGRILGR